MSEEISVPRFPILGFRIPKSVWHMGNHGIPHHEIASPRGAHRRAGAGDGHGRRGGGGHGMSYTNSGVGHWMTDGGKTETRGTLFT